LVLKRSRSKDEQIRRLGIEKRKGITRSEFTKPGGLHHTITGMAVRSWGISNINTPVDSIRTGSVCGSEMMCPAAGRRVFVTMKRPGERFKAGIIVGAYGDGGKGRVQRGKPLRDE